MQQLPAGIGDVLTGLFALQAAIAVATGTAEGRRAATLSNIFGLADFAVAITMGMIGAGDYPGVLTPAFVVPSSILLHALSLRQLAAVVGRRQRGDRRASRHVRMALVKWTQAASALTDVRQRRPDRRCCARRSSDRPVRCRRHIIRKEQQAPTQSLLVGRHARNR
jgi:hypothetical protein